MVNSIKNQPQDRDKRVYLQNKAEFVTINGANYDTELRQIILEYYVQRRRALLTELRQLEKTIELLK